MRSRCRGSFVVLLNISLLKASSHFVSVSSDPGSAGSDEQRRAASPAVSQWLHWGHHHHATPRRFFRVSSTQPVSTERTFAGTKETFQDPELRNQELNSEFCNGDNMFLKELRLTSAFVTNQVTVSLIQYIYQLMLADLSACLVSHSVPLWTLKTADFVEG